MNEESEVNGSDEGEEKEIKLKKKREKKEDKKMGMRKNK